MAAPFEVTENGHENDGKQTEIPTTGSNVMDVREFFGRLQPIIEKGIDAYSKVSPYISEGIIKTKKAYLQYIHPYTKDYPIGEISKIILGIVLLFFGGHFAMTIACYTALQISGWNTVVSSYKKIRQQYLAGSEAFSKDKEARNVFDTDGDGKISNKELTAFGTKWLNATKNEKMAILAKFRGILICIDPYEVMNGLQGIWTVFIAMLVTLRSTFAKDIALGVSLGETLTSSFAVYIKPFVANISNTDDKMKPWIDFLIDSLCKCIGISIALILVRVVSAFHSSIKGGQILAKHLFKFLQSKELAPNLTNNNDNNNNNNNINNNNIEKMPFVLIVQYILAAYGFYWQLVNGFALNNILLRLVLFPFVLLETILGLLAAW